MRIVSSFVYNGFFAARPGIVSVKLKDKKKVNNFRAIFGWLKQKWDSSE